MKPYTVDLIMHEDDANGEVGLCHKNTVGTFNAFWGADGIFHDVFEHYFEGMNRHFFNKKELTLWGEMCASGHAIAYKDIGIDSFQFRSSYKGRDFTADTMGILNDAFYQIEHINEEYPYLEYSVDRELCGVPYQKQINHYNLDSWINDYLYSINQKRQSECKKVAKFAKSISRAKIKDCYIYGYKQAMKIIGNDKHDSYQKLEEFLQEWNTICKSSPRDLYIDDEFAYPIKGFNFVISNSGKLKIKTSIIDEAGNLYPIESLIN